MRSLLTRIENVPLTRLLAFAFAMILLCSIAIIAVISIQFADRIMGSVAEQTARNSVLEIQSRTEQFLTIADQTVQSTALAVRAGRVNIDDADTLSRYLWDRALDQNAELVSTLYYASEQGHLMSISVPELADKTRNPRVKFVNPENDKPGNEYSLTPTGSLGTVTRELGNMDPRIRPWYRQAVNAAGKAVWSDVYEDYNGGQLMITRAVTVTNDAGLLLGVAAVDLSLQHFQNFLHSLRSGEKNAVFIFNENGQLLATNLIKQDLAQLAGTIRTSEAADPTTHAAFEFVSTLPDAAEPGNELLLKTIRIAGMDNYLAHRSIGGDSGVNWNLVIFLPSSGFLESAGNESYMLLFLISSVAGLCLAFMLGFLRLVVNPLNCLTADAREIASGNFDLQIENDNCNEVGELSRSIANMQRRLKTTIAHLKEANLLLKRENNRIETTLGSLDDGVITFGVDGTIQFMNKAAERKTGWAIKRIRGSTINKPGEDENADPARLRFQTAVRQAISDYKPGGRKTVTSLYQDESDISVSCRLTTLFDLLQRPQGAVLVFNELSELLQLKREHEQTIAVHRQLSHVVEETANEVYVVEPDTFRITMMNRAARTNLGYSLEDSRHLTLHQTIDKFRDTFPSRLFDDFKNGRLSRTVIDTVHCRKDGSVYPTETRLHYIPEESPPYFALIAQDTSERLMQMQDLLLRDRAIAALDVGVFIIEQEKKCLLYANRAMTVITGYQASELIGRTPDIFTGDERQIGAENYPWRQDETKPLLRFNLSCQRKDLSSYAAELSLSYMPDPSGKGSHCIGILEDVSSRKLAEESLRHAQKFDAIGRLSGGIAHDFNNLLNIISGRLEFLYSLTSDETHRLHIQEAERAADMGARLTRRLLAFARQSPLEPSVIDLNRLIVDTLAILKTTLSTQVSVKTDLAMELWEVHTDRSEIENALINLAINARDAMPTGGTIIIRTDNVCIRSPASRFLSLSAGDYACLSITDTGEGMDQETLSRIFEPFFTTKEPGKGTGLGLASIFGFVRQSGGDVVAKSTIDSGTTITIYLPRYQATTLTSRKSTLKPEQRSARTGNDNSRLRVQSMNLSVLIVEDNQQVLELTEARMAVLGLGFTSIRSGAEAIAHIEADHRYDLLFCDVALENGVSGYEVARTMQDRCESCRVLLTSGFSESMLTSEHDSEFPVLQKPYGVDALAETIVELFTDETSSSVSTT